ncbi:UNVERIFIED_CONTAM: hypothetical protein GTU68_042362, partial [Idotea baltica]|nr:hypothetical protein [Idotea baltica]
MNSASVQKTFKSMVYTAEDCGGSPPLLHLQHDSLKEISLQSGEILAPGTLVNTNTIEDFKKQDKTQLLQRVANNIWKAILSGEAEKNPQILSSFLSFIYADLKKYHYYYWFAFPAFLYPGYIELVSPIQTLEEKIKNGELLSRIESALRSSALSLAFFTLVIEAKESVVKVLPLSSYQESLKNKGQDDVVWLGFSDPSSAPSHPGWPLRNLLTLAAVRWPATRRHSVIALREKVSSESCS